MCLCGAGGGGRINVRCVKFKTLRHSSHIYLFTLNAIPSIGLDWLRKVSCIGVSRFIASEIERNGGKGGMEAFEKPEY